MATFQFYTTFFVQLDQSSHAAGVYRMRSIYRTPQAYIEDPNGIYIDRTGEPSICPTLTPSAYIECEAYIERRRRISKIPTGSISTGQEPSLRPMVIIGQFSALIFAYLHTATWLPAGGLTFLFRQESKQRSRPGEALVQSFVTFQLLQSRQPDFKAALPRSPSRRFASVKGFGCRSSLSVLYHNGSIN